jgi:ribulose kinase
MTGAICGLKLEKGVQDLAKSYLAAVQAVAYGTRHIVEEMEK